MNSIEKRCFIGSATIHSLLALVLLVGPGFLTKEQKVEDQPVIDFVPSLLIDAALAGGGNPNASPLPPQNKPDNSTPPPPRIQEEPRQDPPPPPVKEPTKQPDPVPDKVVKTNERDPDSLESADNKWTPRKPTADLTKKARPNADAKKKAAAEAAERERRARDARLATARSLLGAANSISAASGTRIEIGEYGPGGGGPAYASYAAWVKKKYDEARIAPDDAASDNAVVKVTVVIARSGKVVEARIAQASGDSLVDRSVRRALDRVDFVAPFPEGSRDQERTYTIYFDLKTKRATG